LKHVLEPAFPGVVEFNQRQTADEVVRVEILDTADPFLNSLLGPNDDPQWWLEGSSYPIRILDENKVHVLVKSKDIQEKYGESPVFVTFDYEGGKIYHMISHFYLQRSETRTKTASQRRELSRRKGDFDRTAGQVREHGDQSIFPRRRRKRLHVFGHDE
jgi:hypothetical protein